MVSISEETLDIYTASRNRGLSIMGALTVLAQASFESEYGRGKGVKVNNYFGILYAGDGFTASKTVRTSHGPFRMYTSLEEGIGNYFTVVNRNWSEALELYDNENITAEGINTAFKIGKNGGYTDDPNYGSTLLGTRKSVIKRIIGDLTIHVSRLQTRVSSIEYILNKGNPMGLTGFQRLFSFQEYIEMLNGKEKLEEREGQATKAIREIKTKAKE